VYNISILVEEMALPAWKLAVQERKKKKEEEEKLKMVHEEKQKLASLPAWKRAIIMREKKAGEERSPPASASPGPATRRTDSSNNTSQDSLQKWQVAVERVKGPDSPILKRAPPTSVQIAPALTTSSTAATSNNSSNSSSSGSNQKPAAQRNVLNRWTGAAAAPSPTTSGTSANSSSAASGRAAHNKRQDSTPNSTGSPAVRRAATFTAGSGSSYSPISRRPVPSSSGSNSPRTRTVASKWPSGTNSTGNSTGSASPAPSVKSSVGAAKKNASVSSTGTAEEDDPSLAHLPPWKRAIILKKRRAQQAQEAPTEPMGRDETDSGPAPVKSVAKDKETESKSRSGNKKASSKSGREEAGHKPGQEGSRSGREGSKDRPRQEPAGIVIKQPVPEVVNRQTEDKASEQRLVQQEGKTLHPPIYKEVDQWANVAEEDEKFKKLPLWKQALIKRRRADIAIRSGQQVSVSPTLPPDDHNKTTPAPESPNKSADKRNKSNGPSRLAKDGKSTKKTGSSNVTRSTKKQQPSSMSKSTSSTSKSTSSTSSKPPSGLSPRKAKEPVKSNTGSSSSAYKPARKAPSAPVSKKQEKSEPMFSYNFSKHHSLDTGGSSSDCTDSDLEDAVVTNLDGDSDESDSGIVLQSYTSSSSSSSSNLKKNSDVNRSSSILIVPGKEKKKVSYALHIPLHIAVITNASTQNSRNFYFFFSTICAYRCVEYLGATVCYTVSTSTQNTTILTMMR